METTFKKHEVFDCKHYTINIPFISEHQGDIVQRLYVSADFWKGQKTYKDELGKVKPLSQNAIQIMLYLTMIKITPQEDWAKDLGEASLVAICELIRAGYMTVKEQPKEEVKEDDKEKIETQIDSL